MFSAHCFSFVLIKCCLTERCLLSVACSGVAITCLIHFMCCVCLCVCVSPHAHACVQHELCVCNMNCVCVCNMNCTGDLHEQCPAVCLLMSVSGWCGPVMSQSVKVAWVVFAWTTATQAISVCAHTTHLIWAYKTQLLCDHSSPLLLDCIRLLSSSVCILEALSWVCHGISDPRSI